MRSDRFRVCTADEYQCQPYFVNTSDMQRRLFVRVVWERMYADEGGWLRIAAFVLPLAIGFLLASFYSAHWIWYVGFVTALTLCQVVWKLRWNYVALEMLCDYQARLETPGSEDVTVPAK